MNKLFAEIVTRNRQLTPDSESCHSSSPVRIRVASMSDSESEPQEAGPFPDATRRHQAEVESARRPRGAAATPPYYAMISELLMISESYFLDYLFF